MLDELYQWYYDFFFEQQKAGKDPFLLLRSPVTINLLCDRYEKDVKAGFIVAIENLPAAQHEFYLSIGKRFYGGNKAISAATAAYSLAIITNTHEILPP